MREGGGAGLTRSVFNSRFTQELRRGVGGGCEGRSTCVLAIDVKCMPTIAVACMMLIVVAS